MKKIFVFLALVLLFSCTGCGDDTISTPGGNELAPDDKVLLSESYLNIEPSFEAVKSEDQYYETFNIDIQITGDTSISYFECSVDVTVTFDALADDGEYHTQTVTGTIYLDRFGNGSINLQAIYKCRYYKPFLATYSCHGKVIKLG